MLRHDFDYEEPETLEGALALLRGSREPARLLAGGTDLVPNMRLDVFRPGLLVSLAAIEPQPPVEEPGGSIRLDALSRLADLESDQLVRRKLKMLAESARAVGSNQIRQMGTLGGNLCQENRCLYLNLEHDYQFTEPCYKRGGERCYPFPGNDPETCWSVYMSDIAPALIAMNAWVEILNEGGIRRIRLEELFSGRGLKPLTLGTTEIIRTVIVPALGPRFGWGYHKSSLRGGLEFAMATVAVALRLKDDGRSLAQLRIAVGAVGEGPLRPTVTEREMTGRVADGATLTEAARDASNEIDPLPHHGFTKSYLRENIRVHLHRCLTRAVERACHGEG